MRDGFLILNTTLALFRDYKPLTFFGGIGIFFMLLALGPGLLVIFDFVSAGAPRVTLAILAVGLVLCGLLAMIAGLVLHSIARRSQEFEYQIQVLSEELRIARPPQVHARGPDHARVESDVSR
jgi:hypothetical protein